MRIGLSSGNLARISSIVLYFAIESEVEVEVEGEVKDLFAMCVDEGANAFAEIAKAARIVIEVFMIVKFISVLRVGIWIYGGRSEGLL
mmetsp:Transcript_14976/g.18984  ORF Transcript_14976/g.18984 Transcript_14976/m.18984 type:complete len:88 (+) Transcript_14976:518-781(+)